MKNNKEKILFILSMIIFGTLAIFVRKINVTSAELALYRAILASLVIFIYMVISKQKIEFKKIKKELPFIILSGIAMGFNWILLFEAYKNTTVSIATLSYYFAPIIVTIVSPFIFKEKISIKQIICFIVSTIGIILITELTNIDKDNNNLMGIIFGISAAILYAIVMIINKCIKSIGGIHRTFMQFLAAIIVLIPYVIITSGFTIGTLNLEGWINLLIVGIIHTGITYCMYFTAISKLTGQNIAILSYIDPLVAILISVLVLNESMTIIQIIGGLTILICAILNEIKVTFKINKANK